MKYFICQYILLLRPGIVYNSVSGKEIFLSDFAFVTTFPRLSLPLCFILRHVLSIKNATYSSLTSYSQMNRGSFLYHRVTLTNGRPVPGKTVGFLCTCSAVNKNFLLLFTEVLSGASPRAYNNPQLSICSQIVLPSAQRPHVTS